jgi:hypothetical protein
VEVAVEFVVVEGRGRGWALIVEDASGGGGGSVVFVKDCSCFVEEENEEEDEEEAEEEEEEEDEEEDEEEEFVTVGRTNIGVALCGAFGISSAKIKGSFVESEVTASVEATGILFIFNVIL